MKSGVVLAIYFLAFLVIAVNVDAAVYCPGGDCQDQDPPGSRCLEFSVKPCIGATYYGASTACVVGTSECVRGGLIPGTHWDDCQGWQTANYQATEDICDNIDNDCDGSVDEGGVCSNTEACFNNVDDNGNNEADCQDSSCIFNLVQQLKSCIPLRDVDVDDSGRTDGFDLNIIGRAFGTRPGDAAWDARADIDKDLYVSQADIDWLGANFGLNIPANFTCARKPANIFSGWKVPENTTSKAIVSAKLELGDYKIEFLPLRGRNYTVRDDNNAEGACCQRDVNHICINYVSNEIFSLLYVVRDDTLDLTFYVPVATQEIAGSCGLDPISKGIVQANWSWKKALPGQTDCSNLNCLDKRYTWNDVGNECSYLYDDFGFNLGIPRIGGNAYLKVPAGQASTWRINDILYLGNEQFRITCIELAGNNNCGGISTSSHDKAVLDSSTNKDYFAGTVLGVLARCSTGDQLSCDESRIASEFELIDVSISGNCAAGSSLDCEPGDTISITANFANTFSSANNIQIDASGPAGSNCDIAYLDIPAGSKEITNGINSNIAVSSNQVIASWTITSVPSSCYGVTINPVAAAIYSGGPPGSGMFIDNTGDTGDTLTGSFIFYNPSGTTSVTSTSITSTTVSSTTSIGGSSLGFCGDGELNLGEQCDSDGSMADADCQSLGNYDRCDIDGFVTDVSCSCYLSSADEGTETVIFTTSCQDTGEGMQGVRTETTRILDSDGNLISETSQQVACTLPPVNVPGFTLINIILAIAILVGYYINSITKHL